MDDRRKLDNTKQQGYTLLYMCCSSFSSLLVILEKSKVNAKLDDLLFVDIDSVTN